MEKRTRYQLCLNTITLLKELKSSYQKRENISELDPLDAYYEGKRYAFDMLENHFERMAKIFEYENFDIADAN